jgi:hypothetical protein
MKLQVYTNVEVTAVSKIDDVNYQVTLSSNETIIKCKMYAKEKPEAKKYSVVIVDTFDIKTMTGNIVSLVGDEQSIYTFASGKLARNSETRYSTSGTKYTTYSVAGKSCNKDNDGKYPGLYTNTTHFRCPDFMSDKLTKECRGVGLLTETKFETYNEKLQEKNITKLLNIIYEDRVNYNAVDIGF